MEQNEKNEKPAWVIRVESLPVAVQQQVGTICAGCISSLVQLGLFDFCLYTDVWTAAHQILKEYESKREAVDMDSEDLDSHENV